MYEAMAIIFFKRDLKKETWISIKSHAYNHTFFFFFLLIRNEKLSVVLI